MNLLADIFHKIFEAIYGDILILQVVTPLFMAVIVFLVKNRLASWLLTVFTLFAVFVMSLVFSIYGSLDGNYFQYYLGSWEGGGIGIEYSSAGILSSVVTPLASLSAFIAVLWSRRLINEEVGEKYNYFNSALLIVLSGLLGMVFTNDLFNLFVFLEISSLATYIMLSLNKQNSKCYISSLNYLIVGTVAATLYVFGVGILYASTGHLNFTEVAMALSVASLQKHHILAFALIFAGLFIKVGVFPLHAWMAQVYKNSPSTASIFLAAVATKIIVFVIIKILVLVKIMNIDIIPSTYFSAFSATILAIGLISALAGSYLAIKADDFASMLALSSAGQIGYIIMALAIGSELALYAALMHILNHGIMKLSLFMTRANIAYSANVYTFSEIKNKGFYNPFIFLGLIVSGLSIIGMPGTAGFVSKYYLILGILSAENVSNALAVVLIGFVLFSSLLAVMYVWKAVEAMWFNERSFTKANPLYKKTSLAMNAGYFFVVGLNILLGLLILIFWFYIG